MSNYLSHLVARSLDRVEVIQPRPLSLFEPLSQTAVAAPPSPIPAAPGAAEMANDPAVATPRPQPTRLTPAAPPTAPLAAAGPPAQRQIGLPSATGPVAVRPVQPPAPDFPSRQTAPRPPSAIVRQVAAGRLVSTATPPLKPMPAQANPIPAPANPEVLYPAESAPLPHSPFTIHHSPFTIFQPHVQPYIASPARPVAAPEPAPTIQVTIGRIEVRATAPAPPKADKEQPPAPVMSLDDYLRRRNGGQK